MNSFQKSHHSANRSSDVKLQLDNFSSSIALPTRKRHSIFQNHEDHHFIQTDTDNSSLAITKQDFSTDNFQNQKQQNQNQVESNKIECSSVEISSAINCQQQSRNRELMSPFFFQQSDSLLNKYNPLYSQHKIQLRSNFTSTQQQKEIITQKNKQECLIEQDVQIQVKGNLEIIEERFSRLNFFTQNNLNQQPPIPIHQPQNHLQTEYSFQQKKYIKQQSNYYVEWPEVFDQPTMMQLYHKYTPTLTQDEQLLLIIKAISKAAQSQICGKIFMEQAFDYYKNNYGRMSFQDFIFKVIGDVLYLFRKYNQKREKYEKERFQYEEKERQTKKTKTKH